MQNKKCSLLTNHPHPNPDICPRRQENKTIFYIKKKKENKIQIFDHHRSFKTEISKQMLL